ncbi:MAG: glycosyltransferase [Holophagaceae bacterium]|nr:glycosyltransferase [Holophagaceae bacterium]
MIVKNESRVIRRCLDSIRPFIQAWLIVDTGSTDGTQDIIRDHMKDIPGELVERPWKDFGHNRSEAAELARSKADYLIFIDADNEFVAPEGWRMPDLAADIYTVVLRDGESTYHRASLAANRLPWRYKGVLHEHLDCGGPYEPEVLEGPYIRVNTDGARSQDPLKFEKDARLLETALAEEPDNARYAFYLAQSYRDSAQPLKAREAYLRRAAMGGWDEEVWYSLLEVAKLSQQLDMDEELVIRAYMTAHRVRPIRAEALCYLAAYCRARHRYSQGFGFAKEAAAIPRPEDILFLDDSVYTWRALDEWSILAYWTGQYPLSKTLCERLLVEGRAPLDERPRIVDNLNFSLRALGLPLIPVIQKTNP